MKCSICLKTGKSGYIKHQTCPHYVCTDCVHSSLATVNFHPAQENCQDCEVPPNYEQECPSCWVTYTPNCPRALLDSLLYVPGLLVGEYKDLYW